jgi:hypothetical protein
MANCPKCSAKITFLAALSPGGRFNCKNCHSVIYKKVSNELLLIFACVGVAVITKFIVAGLLADDYQRISALQFFIYATVPAVLMALLTLKIIWDNFIKL